MLRILSARHHSNKEVARNCTHRYVDAMTIIFDAKQCISPTKTPITSIYNYIEHICILL